jgi:glycosyltransferase involved in cell wall biosynthesis
MEVLFISHKYPPSIGGMEKQSYELVSCTEKYHKVHKVLLNKEEENIVHFFWKLKSRVKKILQENPSIDIIHLNDGLMGYFCFWLQGYTKIPIIVTFHGLDIVFPNKWFQNSVVPRFRKFDAFISVSTATYEECIQRGFDEKKMYVVPNGVDHDLIDLKVDAKKIKTDFQEKHRIDLDKRHIIVSLGRPVVRKGFSWFLENVLPRLDEDVLFIMIGPNSANKRKPLWKKILPGKWVYQINLFLGLISDEEKIMELLQKSGIKNKVVRTGAIPFNEVMGLLELADLFVMPNVKVEGDAEGFGLVALEASLRKTPVLASNMEGITEAIKNAKNGYLLPSEDATAWSEKIKTLLANKEGLTILGKQFSQFTLNTFGWDKMVEGYIDVFEKVIADRKDA